MNESQDRLWTINDVASYLDIPVSSVYKMTSAKSTTSIPHIKLGGRLRFRQKDIDEWLDLWAVDPTESLAKAKQMAMRVRR